MQGQFHAEDSSALRQILSPHSSAELTPYQTCGTVKPQAGSHCPFRRHHGVKQPFHNLRGNSRSAVLHLDQNIPVFLFRAEGDLPAFLLHGIHGIVHQIVDHLYQIVDIPL